MQAMTPGTLDPATIPPNPGGPVLVASAGKLKNKVRSRTTLQAFTDDAFVPPVPEFRPGTIDGNPVDVSALNRVEPAGLISGFVAGESRNSGFDAINRRFVELPRIASPETGMGSLQHMVAGPFTNKRKVAIAEHILLKWGPATINQMTGSGSWFVQATVVKDDLPQVRKQLAVAGIRNFSKQH